MSTNARKRLMRDFKRIQNEPPEGIQAAPLGKQYRRHMCARYEFIYMFILNYVRWRDLVITSSR